MLQAITTIPEYRVYEYLLILSPTSGLYQRILSIKYDFARKYQAPLAAYTKPHITLINFLAYEKTEEKILNRFRLISRGITPFTIQLENFGSFDASRTIYLDVAIKDSIRYLVQELQPTKY